MNYYHIEWCISVNSQDNIRVLIPFGSLNRFLWQKRTVQISEQKFGVTFSEELKYSKV